MGLIFVGKKTGICIFPHLFISCVSVWVRERKSFLALFTVSKGVIKVRFYHIKKKCLSWCFCEVFFFFNKLKNIFFCQSYCEHFICFINCYFCADGGIALALDWMIIILLHLVKMTHLFCSHDCILKQGGNTVA